MIYYLNEYQAAVSFLTMYLVQLTILVRIFLIFWRLNIHNKKTKRPAIANMTFFILSVSYYWGLWGLPPCSCWLCFTLVLGLRSSISSKIGPRSLLLMISSLVRYFEIVHLNSSYLWKSRISLQAAIGSFLKFWSSSPW